MPRFLAGIALVLFSFALFTSVAWAAEAAGDGGGGDALGYLGGASGVGGLSIVGYLLIRYLPKRDEDLMSTLKEKDETVIALIQKKDEQVFQALKEKDEMWSALLEKNDSSWQAKFDEVITASDAMRKTNGKLRQALLTSLNKPSMTALGVQAMDEDGT